MVLLQLRRKKNKNLYIYDLGEFNKQNYEKDYYHNYSIS